MNKIDIQLLTEAYEDMGHLVPGGKRAMGQSPMSFDDKIKSANREPDNELSEPTLDLYDLYDHVKEMITDSEFGDAISGNYEVMSAFEDLLDVIKKTAREDTNNDTTRSRW